MKLKTLDDFDIELKKQGIISYLIPKLKEEAIKWIKNYQKIIDEGVRSMDVFKLEGAIEVLSHFCNITEAEK